MEQIKNAGGYAFPFNTDEFFNRGMTLRDWFAGQALVGMIAKGHCIDNNVRDAYAYADAMLVERKKEPQPRQASQSTDDGFTAWMSRVDTELVRLCGIDSGSLPDMDYRSMFDDDTSAEEAAQYALDNAKEN